MMDDVEREIRAKIRAELETARDRWAPDVPDHSSPYRRGINLALLVIDGHLDQPLSTPLTMTAMEIGPDSADRSTRH
jgi:hypothetical protein